MAQVITIAGERLFALKAQNNQQLDIDTFIFAFVPGQDSSALIDRNEGLPPIGQRVHTQIVQQTGLINENAVVYSSVLDSLTGPFDFNWVGLYSSVNQTLIAIIHTPTVSKTVTVPGAAGNILNRNFVIEYSGIAELTGIVVDKETWQLDYTARLNGMDELTRQLAADMNGKDWFIDNGLKVVSRSTLNTFKVTAGVGYISGLRVTLAADHILTLSSYPQFVYVDAWFDGTSESIWKGHTAFTVTNTEMDDYIDVNGRNHYVFKLARITAANAVEDLRTKQRLDKFARIFKNVNDMATSSGHEIGKRYITGRTAWEVVDYNTNVPLLGGVYAKALSPVSPVDFEADVTGSTDSTFAFISARNSAKESSQSLVWDFGAYKLKDYNILDNDIIFSEGAIISPIDNESISILVDKKNDWKLLGTTYFKGGRLTLEDKEDTGECGLKIVGGTGFKMENIVFYRFKGCGYLRLDDTFEYYGNKAQVNNVTYIECLQGSRLFAQYDVYTNMNAIANELGVESLGGNLNWIGGNVTDNYDGFKITDYPNNAHGIISGVQFNHNKRYTMDIDKTREGFTFADCHVYAGDDGEGRIKIKHSRGLDFTGGTYDCWFEIEEYLGIEEDNYLRNVYAPGGYGTLKIFNPITGKRSTSMRVSGVYGNGAINAIDGLNVNDLAAVAYAVKRPSVSPQTIDSGVPTELMFSEVDKLGDVRGNLESSGNAIFEFPCVIKGYYEICSDFVIAGDTISDLYVEIVVDGVVDCYKYGINIGQIGGKLGFMFEINKKVYSEHDIKLRAVATGTGIVHAIQPFNSTLQITLSN